MSEIQNQSYLKELGRRLNYLGFQTNNQGNETLAVAKSGKHLCEISESGGIRFRAEDLTKVEEELVRGTVKAEATTTLEYMKLMAEAPEMKTGDEISHYKLLADFNGVVQAVIRKSQRPFLLPIQSLRRGYPHCESEKHGILFP